MRQLRAVSLALVMFLLVVTGCSSQGGSPSPAAPAAQPATPAQAPAQARSPAAQPAATPVTGGQVIVATIADIGSLNPIYTSDTSSSFVTGLVHKGLTQVNEQMGMDPAIAERWDTSADGKTWTFHLRRNAKWHDGQPVTARDAAFTYLSILHPLYGGPRQSNYASIAGYEAAKKQMDVVQKNFKDKKIDEKTRDEQLERTFAEFKQSGGIAVVDDYTLRITLDKPYAPFLSFAVGMGLIPEHILKDVRPDKMKDHETNRKPMGNGPFKFVEHKPGDRVIMAANPDYWDGRPNLDRIVYRILPDMNAVAVALETGEIDHGPVLPELFDRFKTKQNLNIYEFMTASYAYVGYNLKNPLFQDKRVRQALTQAMDREAMVEAVLLGHGAVAHSHGAPVRWDYNPDVPQFRYDKAKASALLAEAGWTKGANGILTKNGKPLQFTLETNQNKVREQYVAIIQQQLKEVGVQMEIKVLEWQTFLKRMDSQEFDALLLGWSLGVDPDAYQIWHSSQTQPGQFNAYSFKNQRVDALLEQGRVTLDPTKRKPFYAEMQKILAEEQPYTWLTFANSLNVANKKIMGIPAKPGAMGTTLNITKWWIPKDKQ